uniref:Uncharacterized protein n=1 Tax=viral metagenome TaxID=1070528 RepID=A0A6C0ITB2_9ZZZZ
MSTEISPPEEFAKIINEFTSDILNTFPEYTGIIGRWWNRSIQEGELVEKKRNTENLFVFKHCIKVFPERFFDILYQNADMFGEQSEVNTEFLPGIVFKQLWLCDISEKTRITIWNYLKLILFAVIGSVHNTSELGDTAKLFEAINEDELKTKLQETFESMKDIFDNNSNFSSDASNNVNFDFVDGSSSNPFNMPNPDELHNHINGLMGGKLGKLAMELAEETANDLNLDMENMTNTKDVFEKLFKNPSKLMNMVKNVGSKLDEKIKSGEIKESELMEEGMDLLNKMKNMPGMDNMQKIFSQMGMPGLGKGSKMNMGAMESQLNKNMKTAKMKERMREKAENLSKMKDAGFCNMSDANINQKQNQMDCKLSDEEIFKIFSTGEKVEKTPRGAKPININTNTSNKKAKKNKK